MRIFPANSNLSMRYRLLYSILTTIIMWNGIFVPNAIAQTNEIIDSLQSQLRTSSIDTSKVQLLNELAWELKASDFRQALQYAKEALSISKDINYSQGKAVSYNRLGIIQQYKGNLDTALLFYQNALAIEQEINHLYGIARAKNQIAMIYQRTNQVQAAIEYFREALEIFESLQEEVAKANVNSNLGFCYRVLGISELALNHYLEALKIREEMRDSSGIAKSNISLGNYYERAKDYKNALKYYQRAENIYNNSSNKYQLAKVYHNIGLVYKEMNDYPIALEFMEKSLALKKKLNTTQGLNSLLNSIGTVLFYLNREDEAIQYYSQSIEVSKKNNDEKILSEAFNNMGLLYQQKGAKKIAIDYYLKSLRLKKKSLNTLQRLSTLINLSNSYAEIGNYKKSLEYAQQYKLINDSLETGFREAIHIKEAYEEEKKKRELAEKDQEIQFTKLKAENIRNTILVYALSGGLALVSILFFTILKFYQNRRKLRKKNQEVEDLLLNQELHTMGAMLESQEAERNRIAQDLHDRLGGLLSVVKLNFEAMDEQIDELKSQNKEQYIQANKLLNEACDEVRKIAHDMVSGVLKKFGLIPALREMEEAIAKSNKLAVNLVDVGFEDRRLETSTEIVIYRIIQELVSNVLKHAEASKLEIQLFWRKDGISITIEDNGKGFDIESPKYQSGMGLKNVQSRVKSLNGDISFDSQEGKGTSILIDLAHEITS